MSLTEEECLFALKSLKPANIYEFIAKGYLPFTEANSILTQLINEHFDNTSLKIDELKPNMVVWDNQLKEFIKIEEVLKDVNIITYHVFGESILCGGDFEEDIYYRFEVKDDVHK